MEITVNIVDTLFDSIPKGTVVANYVTEVDTVNFKMYSTVYSIDETNKAIVTTKKVDANNLEAIHFDAINWVTTDKATIDNIYPKIVSKYQNKFKKEGVIYKITKDYDLNNCILTIPDNCTLQFEGGTITNGSVIGNINNDFVRPEWFGAKGDNKSNDSLAFQISLNLCNNSDTCKTIKLEQSHYLIDNIIIYSYITLEGADKYKTILSSFGKLTDSPLITTGIEQGQNITIKNLCIESEGARTEYTIKIINKLGVTIDNCYIVRHDIEAITDKHGIFIGRDSTTPNATVYIPKFTNNRVNQCCVTIEGTDGYIDHNEIWGIGCESALHLMKSGNHMITSNQIVGGSVYGALYCTEWATALKIFGNYFDGSSTAVANVPFGINVTANLTYSIISNNNFWHLYGVGIKVTTSTGNTINGNVFENNDTSDVGNSDIVFMNTQSGSITNNSFVRAGVTRINKAPVLNITGYTGTSYEPIIISGNTVRGYTNYSNAVYTPIDSTIKTSNNNCSIFEYISNANQYKIFNPYGELNYNSSETIKASPLDAKVFTYVETNKKIRLDNLNYVDSTALTGDNKFDFNKIYNKDFNLYINNYGSVLNPPAWITGAMWLENRYLTTGYCRQIIYSSNGNTIYSRICNNSVWSDWVNSDNTSVSKIKYAVSASSFKYSNVTYKVITNIDLEGNELSIPINCTLDFQGGSFSNGTIIGNNTKIINSKVLFNDCILQGTFNIDLITDSMLTNADDIDKLKNISILSSGSNYKKIILNNDYVINSFPIDSYALFRLYSNTDLVLNGSISVNNINFPSYNIIFCSNASNISITGGKLVGDVDNHIGETGEFGYGISLASCENVVIKDINISKCWGDGIAILRDNWDSPTDVRPCKNITIDNVICDSNRRQGLSIIALEGGLIRNSKFINTGTIKYTAPGYGIDLEPNNQYEQIKDVVIDSCEFTNNVDSTSNYDKSLVLYAPTNKNITNITIKNCITTGELSLNGCKNTVVTNSNIYTCAFNNVTLEDNNTISCNNIRRAEKYSWRNIIKLINNAWAFSAEVKKIFTDVSSNTKLVIPNFVGTLKITVLSNYSNYIKTIYFSLNDTYSKKSYTQFINTGEIGPIVSGNIINESFKCASPIIKDNNIEIVFKPVEDSILHTIFVEAIYLYLDSTVKFNESKFNIVYATAEDIANSDFSELVLNPLRVNDDTKPTNAQLGQMCYDSVKKKMILWNGTAWTNLDGTALN